MSEAYHVKTKKELIETLEGIQQERNFNSRGETLQFLVQIYQGKPLGLEKPIECKYLSIDGSICGKEDKFKKTTPEKCELCQRITKQHNKRRREEYERVFGMERVWTEICGELDIDRWKYPNETTRFAIVLDTVRELNVKGFLDEKAELEAKAKTMANALLERDRRIALLEEMASPKLFEENQRLRFELSQKEKQLEDYTKEIEKLEALNEKLRKFLPTTTFSMKSV